MFKNKGNDIIYPLFNHKLEKFMNRSFWVKKYLKVFTEANQGFWALLIFFYCVTLFVTGFGIYSIFAHDKSGIFIFVGGCYMIYDCCKKKFYPLWLQVKQEPKNAEEYRMYLIVTEKQKLLAVAKKHKVPVRKARML